MIGGALTSAFYEESDGPCRRRLGLGVALRGDLEEHSQRLAWRPQGRPVVPVGSCSSLADSRAERNGLVRCPVHPKGLYAASCGERPLIRAVGRVSHWTPEWSNSRSR